MAARAGIEPYIRFLDACAASLTSNGPKIVDPHQRAQDLSALTEIVRTWPTLPQEFRTTMQALTQSAPK